MVDKRLYGTGAKLALLVSLCMNSAPTTQGNTEVVGAVGSGRDFVVSSVDYLGYHGASARTGCCRQCTREFPGTQMFSYNNQMGICGCLKITPGVNPTTTEVAGSFAGLCGNSQSGRGRGRSQRRRRARRRGRGRRAGGSASPSRSPTTEHGNPPDCEKPGNVGYEENSPLCNGKGTYKCGNCECPSDSFGQHCECDAANLRLHGDLEDGCRPDNNSTNLCNNRGDCICGKCECYPREVEGEWVAGDFCECDNFSCDRHKGLLCSGPDHGECVCGKCSCNSEWDVEGYSACECRNSQETCITPHGEHISKVCSGHGTCSCGECSCTETEEGQHSGKYCEECPTCPGKCAELKPCVQCQQFKSGEFMDGMDDYDEDGVHRCDKCPFEPMEVDTIYDDDEGLCANNADDDDCRFTFAYGYSRNGVLQVWVQKTKECSEGVDINDSQKLEVDPKICLDLVACVQCQQFNSGEYMDGVDDVDQDGVAACDKCQFKPVGVELKAEGWKGFPSLADDPVCTFIDDDMCSFSFIYRYHIDGGLPMVWAQKNKTC